MTSGDSFEVHQEVAPIYAEWQDLALQVRSDPFAMPGWVQAWHRSFGGGPLEVHVLRRDGRLVALAPFLTSRRLLSSPTNWHTPHYEILALDLDAATALIRQSIARMPARLRIRFVAATGITSAAIAGAAGELGIAVYERPMTRSPVILLDGDFETYRRGLSKNLRKNLRRRQTRMEELGKIELGLARPEDDLEAGLEAAFAIEASGWKGEKGTAITSEASTRRFYSEMAAWAAEAGMLRLAFLRAGETPIAFDLGLESHGVYYSLKTGYEAEHHRLGPGAALTYELIRRCFDQGLDRIALLGSEDEFKRKWAGDSAVDLVELQAFKGPLATFDRFVQVKGREVTRDLVKKLRSSTAA